MAGRPRVLCEAKLGEICALVSAGSSIEAAARYVSCSVLTIRREARRNRQFHESLRRSRISAELNPIQMMRSAATSEWRAAAWLLERTQPQRFAKRPPNSFSQEEVVELLGRVCDVIRQETRDAEKFARIKRRVVALAPKSIRLRNEPFRTQLAPPPSQAEAEHELPASVAAQAPSSPAATSPSTDQNVTDMDPILICVADLPPGNSRSFSTTHGSK